MHLDTSVLVDALAGRRRSARELRRVVERGERIAISMLALYEWLRGPRVETELADKGRAAAERSGGALWPP
jgi:predicted nucleic acid-binding protein